MLFGGCSSEHEVSLASAAAVIGAFDEARFKAVPVGIARNGAWFVYDGEPDAIASGDWSDGRLVPAVASTDRRARGLLLLDSGLTLRIDAAFPVLHGRGGEDGGVQGVFELAGIPLVGCGVAGSAICADKLLSHRIAQSEGVPVAAHAVATKGMRLADIEKRADELGYPLFVKPPREGSSIGLSRVEDPKDLEEAVRVALLFDDVAVLEESVEGVEIGCAIMESAGRLVVGELDEVALNGSVFDFHEKYTCETADIVVPARISDSERQRIVAVAKHLFRVLGCTGFARIDLFLSTDGRILFNEANTIPGFTEHSRFPAMLAAAGLSLTEVLTLAIEEALSC